MSHAFCTCTYRGRVYRIPADEPPESFFPASPASSGSTVYEWDPAGDDGDGPAHAMLIGWTADADGIDADNLAIRHTESYVWAPNRTRVEPMPGMLVAFAEWLDVPENTAEVVAFIDEKRSRAGG